VIAPPSLNWLNGPVVVAMIAMGVVQTSGYKIVDVVTMRYGLVSAVRAMRV
jgi:hypothetical protein